MMLWVLDPPTNIEAPSRPGETRLRGAGLTDVGVKREQNEDRFHADDATGLFLVCDGMGGHASGAVASQMAVEHIVSYIQELDPADTLQEAVLPSAVRAANRALFDHLSLIHI